MVDWKVFLDDLFSPPLHESLFAPLPAKSFNQPGFHGSVTDQHKLVEEVGGEAEGEQSLPSENHVMAPAKRVVCWILLKRLRPDCLPEVSDEDERVWERQQGGERSAMENLWI